MAEQLPSILCDAIGDGRPVRSAGRGIWTALPADSPVQPYEKCAATYDRLIGNKLYNRILWGTSPDDYRVFAMEAAQSHAGPFLDVGCGSLVSTASVHALSNRPTVLVDLSLGMLEAARDRLESLVGGVPSHLTLLHADIFDLPFCERHFATVLVPGTLHLFDDPRPALEALRRLMRADGHMFASVLTGDRFVSRLYLAALQRMGEVGRPRSAPHWLGILDSSRHQSDRPPHRRQGAMLFTLG